MTSGEEGKRLREAIGGRLDRRHRLNPELRRRAIAWARRRRAEGATASAIATELGVSQPTVGNWLAQGVNGSAAIAVVRRPTAMREVVVESRAAGALRLVSPNGYRVEGLSLEEATMVLRALG